MLDLLFESGKLIFGWISESRKNKQQFNSNLSIILIEIADLIKDTEKKLSRNEYPTDNCTQMAHLRDNLIRELSGKVDDNLLQMIYNNLEMSTYLENLYTTRKDPQIIEKMKMCSGLFRSLGQLVKIT